MLLKFGIQGELCCVGSPPRQGARRQSARKTTKDNKETIERKERVSEFYGKE